MNVLKPHLRTTVATLLAAGKSQREIERITRVDRKTIRALVRSVGEDGANSPRVATGSGLQIPPPRPPAPSCGPVSTCEPHRAFITEQLGLRRNYTAIYQELVDRFDFTGAYNSVKRFAGSVVAKEPEQFDRLEFAPGEEVQVDYGEGALTRVPGTDRYRRPRLFVIDASGEPCRPAGRRPDPGRAGASDSMARTTLPKCKLSKGVYRN